MAPHNRYPESNVLYRDLRREFPLAVRGEGCWIIADDGRRWLDGVGGAFVATLGHGIPEIADAIADRARRLAYVNGTQFTAESVEALAEALAERAPGDLDYAYFLTSGSDAVEAALKLCRQYWVEAGQPGRHKVLALTPGYHGNTLLALAASGRPRYQTYFREWMPPIARVPAPYPYRCDCRGAEPRCRTCTGDVVEDVILEEGPETVAALIAEPVGGSSTGAVVPIPGYWENVRRICDRHGVLWVADEILSGAGRTGTWSALAPWNAIPDLLVLGKGITGGYAPLAAVLAPKRLLDPIASGSGALLHAQTFVHHPLSCAAGLAALEYLERHELLARCRSLGRGLTERLALLGDHPMVGDIRTTGLLAAVELVRDRQTREPFQHAERMAERVTRAAFEAGLVVWPNTGQADGTAGDLILLAPPFVITEDELDQLVRRLGQALEAATGVTA